MNFALILLICSIFTGLVALLDFLFWAKKRQGKKPNKFIEQTKSFFPIFFSVLLLRSFLVEPFRIPSGSLEPTLLVGDFLAVNKFAYGIRLPVWEKKIIPIADPKVGEIAIFRWPPDPSFDYIKRVVGTGGDKIIYHNKELTINGKKMPQKFIEYTTDESSGKAVIKYLETLNGVDHFIYVRPDVKAQDFELEVPKGSYFMLGDNRDDSSDSRFWGFLEDKYLRGKAMVVWMSWDGNLDAVRWSRLGKIIH